MRETNKYVSFPHFFYIFVGINSIKHYGFHFPRLKADSFSAGSFLF